MKKSYFLLLGLILSSFFTNGQIFAPDGVRMPGDWNGFTNNFNMGGVFDLTQINIGDLRWQTTFEYTGSTGSQNFKFTSGGSGNPWANEWRATAFTIDQLTSVTYMGANANNNSVNVTNGNWYTVNFKDNGYANSEAIFMETAAEPTLINSVTMKELTIFPGTTPSIIIQLNKVPSAEEKFYVRYTNDNFNTNYLASFNIGNDTGIAVLNAFGEGETINYYVFSSTVLNPTADFDMLTMRLNNNSNSNYNYTVGPPIPQITNVNLIDSTTIRLIANTAISSVTATNLSNYSLQNGVSAASQNIGLDTIILTTTTPISGEDTLIVSGLENTSNIPMDSAQAFALFFGIPLSIDFGVDTLIICANESIASKPTVSGGSGNYTYSWTPINIMDNSTSDSVNITSTTPVWIFLEVNDGSNLALDSFYLEVKPIASSNIDLQVCPGESTSIPGNSAATAGIYFDTLSAANGCDSIISYTITEFTSAPLFTSSTPQIDGSFDGESLWGLPYATNSNIGWANAHAKALYVTSDQDYFYFGAEVDAADWQTWGFVISTATGGGPNDPFGHQIDFNYSNGANFVIRGGFPTSGYGTDLVSWNGVAWNYNNLNAGDFNTTVSWVEVRVLKSNLGDPNNVEVQFFITGNNAGEHGNFSSVPEDASVSAWNVSANRSSLTTFSTTIPSLGFNSAICTVDDTLDGPPVNIAGGTWSGNSVIDVNIGSFNPSLFIGNSDILTYTFIDTNNCSQNASITLNAFDLPVINFNITDASCSGNNDGVLLANISNGNGNLIFNWSTGSDSSKTINLAAGSYQLTVTDSIGCQAIDSAMISNSLSISAFSISAQESVLCTGDTAQINISGSEIGVLYQLRNTSDTSVISFSFGNGNAISLLSYSLTDTSSFYVRAIDTTTNCYFTFNDTIQVNTQELPVINISAKNISCYGFNDGIVNALATSNSGGFTYQWDDPANSASSTVNNLAAGVYSVTATDALGCLQSAQITITEPDSITMTASINNALCFGGNEGGINFIASGGSGNLVYSWSNGASTASINNLVAGGYSITVTDDSSCTKTGSFTILEPLPLTSTTITDSNALCGFPTGGVSVIPSGGTAPYTYIWSNSATDSSITGLGAGKYFVSIQDNNNCLIIDSATVSEPTTLNVGFSANLISCFGLNDGALTALVNGGIPPYSYNWSTGDTMITIDSLTANTYSITITDSAGCTAANSFNLGNPMALSVNLTETSNIVCFGDSSAAINSNAIGGSGNLVYNWSNGANSENLTGLAAGIYILTISDENNCSLVDSITINQATPLFSSETVIACNNYILPGGQTVNLSGTYVDSLLSVNNCDSIIETVLSVNYGNTDTVIVNICDNQSYTTAGGTLVNATGFYADTFINVNNCDSVIITDLTVYPSYLVQDTVEICNGDSVIYGNNTISTAGNYTLNFSSISACDSIIELHIEMKDVKNAISKNSPIMDGNFDGLGSWGNPIHNNQLFGWSGARAENLFFTQDRDFYYFGAEVDAADWQSWGFTLNTGIGGGSSEPFGHQIVFDYNDAPDFVIRGGFPNSAYNNELVSWNGSNWNYNGVASTDLGISTSFVEVKMAKSALNNPQTIQIQFFITGNNSGEHGNFSAIPFNEAVNNWNVNGNPSLLNNYSALVHNISIADTIICSSDSIQLPSGIFVNSDGFYIDYLTDVNSCDSASAIQLTLLPSYSQFDTLIICTGDSALMPDGSYLATAGNYNFSFNAIAHCDSVINIELGVIPVSTSSNNVSICTGENYTLPGGGSVNTAGLYIDTLIASLTSCDSIVSTNILLLPSQNISQNLSICDGQSVLLEGLLQTSSGIYVDTFTNLQGCDSIITTNLTILPNYDSLVNITFCDGDSVMVLGNYYSSNTILTDSFLNISGCDSIINYQIQALPILQDSVRFDLCAGDSVFVKGQYRSNSVVLIDTLTANTTNCDSIITYSVVIEPVVELNPTIRICDGDSAFIAGAYRKIGGLYSDTLTAGLGNCDTIINTMLIVDPTYFDSLNITACAGDTVILPSGTFIFIDGIFQETLQSINGCDSSFFISVLFNPKNIGDTTISICSNDSIFLSGDWRFPNTSFTDSVSNQFGCDSIFTYNINSLSTNYTFDTISICSSDSAFINNQYISSAGTYIENYTNAQGCDSVIEIFLLLNPEFSQIDTFNICSGDSILLPGGNTTKVGGIFIDSLQSVNGCDSIFITHVNILPSFTSTDTFNICFGDSILFGGDYLTQSGTYLDTFTSLNGCDSIVFLQIEVLPSNNSFTMQTPLMDGLFDGSSSWGNEIARNNDFGWAGARASSLFITQDENYFYFAASVDAAVWQSWGFAINTTIGGGSSEPFGHIISFAHNNLPDYVIRGGFQNSIYNNELVNWTGTAWNYTPLSVTDYGVSNSFVEVKVAKTSLGNPQQMSVQFFITGDNNAEHATFSAVPSDEIAQSWQGPPTTLNNYAPAINNIQSVDTILCFGESYLLPGGSIADSSGTYIDLFSDINGCDSVAVSTINILPANFTQASVSICSGDKYVLPGGDTVSTSGIYTDTLLAVNGCDSLVTIALNILSPSVQSTTASICDGQSIFLAGAFQSMAGIYTDTLQTAQGCDSVVITTLTVISPTNTTIDVDICNGDSTFIIGNWYNTSITVFDTISGTNGCDSIIAYQVNILPINTDTVNINICAGDSVFLDGQFINSSQIITDSLTSINGCDSIINYNVIVDSVVNIVQQITICNGDSIFLEGAWQFTSGIFNDTLISSTSCDTILNIHLTVDSLTINNFSLNLCFGDFFVMPSGDTIRNTGVYTDSLRNINGCDSIFIASINFNGVYLLDSSISLCTGDSILINGNWYSAPAIVVDSFMSVSNCDSVERFTLIALPIYQLQIFDTICGNDSILIHGEFENTNGTYSATYQSALGCDSTVMVNLYVIPELQSNDTIFICSGDSTAIFGNIVGAPGVYNQSFSTQSGCDSTANIILELYPTYIDSIFISLCTGDSAFIAGSWEFVSGFYLDSSSTANGCDSVVVTELLVSNNVIIQNTNSICFGDSILLGGVFQSQAGIYNDTIISAAGCDTVTITTLNVTGPFFQNDTIELCDGDSLLLPSGSFAKVAGLYTDTLTSAFGCDSVIETVVNVLPAYFVQASASICAGDSLILPDGQIAFSTGVFNSNLMSISGCDSIIVTTVNVLPSYFTQASSAICSGDSIQLPDGSFAFTQGSYFSQFQSNNGCDSIIRFDVNVLPSSFSQASASICQGDSLLLLNGQFAFTQGSYTLHFTNAAGCDSVIELFVFVNDNYFVEQNISICSTDSFQLADGQFVSSTGTYDVAFNTIFGCDSIIRVNLNVGPAYLDSITAEICSNQNYLLPNGQSTSTSGIYNINLNTVNGCDSIFVVDLKVNQAFINNENISICANESYTLPSGLTVNAAGTYNSSFQTVNGCDSIINTNLSVLPLNVNFVTLSLLPGDSISFRGVWYKELGVFTDTLNVSGPNGCDSVIRLTISRGVYVNNLGNDGAEISVYPNPNQGNFQLKLEGFEVANAVLRLIDLNGKLIYDERINTCNGNCMFEINVGRVPTGLYILQLIHKAGIYNKRLSIIE